MAKARHLVLRLAFLLFLVASSAAGQSLFGDLFWQKPDFETNYGGEWKLVTPNAGVSAMHLAITRNNKAIMFDSTIMNVPPLQLPAGRCRSAPAKNNPNALDCSVHAVEFDFETAKSRPLRVLTDTWCSSGGFDADGNLVQSGGFMDGARAVRLYKLCDTCDWEEHPKSFSVDRWYATQATLPDGGFITVGGRHQFSYEFIPKAGKTNPKAFRLQFLVDTTDNVENNLYPFVHLSTDGNLFIFANNRAILLDYKNDKVVRKFPVLAGGSRNYPASGMSALLPIASPAVGRNGPVPAEVIVCGGSTKDAFSKAEKGVFQPAEASCGRLVITDRNAKWKMEKMPIPRIMGDMLILPTADLLIINGAKKGCSAWWFAREPALEPVLYRLSAPKKRRFQVLEGSNTPRMYHSSSAVLPDTSILVSGSNPNDGYKYAKVMFRTEVSVEKFYPPYFDPLLVMHRPRIVEDSVRGISYGQPFDMEFSLFDMLVVETDIRVTLYAPPFTTHGFSMNQRMLVLNVENFFVNGIGRYRLVVAAPPSGVFAPPGYYLLFVVNRGVPSYGVWVQLAEPDLLRSVVSELLRTFLFVFVSVSAAATVEKAASEKEPIIGLVETVAAQAMLEAMMTVVGLDVSAGHMNPVVAIGLAAGGRVMVVQCVVYVIVQLLGYAIPGVMILS
ncbi:hypothetical protein ZIOFF_002927 [Zingiber officinale]|uniref:Aldehyde oxidase GLOX1 n=1 Tax=Zingiber officinale TaxID=94328 RepID=A0A8J5LWB2_ZINOF|nr:hypothetical protein ZIOFF_002927 [Zingiber officinale]